MSLNDRYCRQCGARFTPSREDQWFDQPKCVAAYYRANPNPEYIHAENFGQHWHTCEWCGVDFYVNDYAERGGKRAPKYCSVAHKQAAYRQRGKDTQEQAARRSSADRGSAPKGQQNPPPHQGSRQQSAPPPKQAPKQDADQSDFQHEFSRKFVFVGRSGRSGEARDAARFFMGLSPDQNPVGGALTLIYKKRIAQYHPDVNTDPLATKWAQGINWAYDYLKNRF